MKLLGFLFEPAFWILRFFFVLLVYGYLKTDPHVPVPPSYLLAACGLLWFAAGLFVSGLKRGEGAGRVFAACLLDLVPAVLLVFLSPSVAVTGVFLLPLLDASLGDDSLLGFVIVVGILEIIVLDGMKKSFVLDSFRFYARFAPLLLSLLFSYYVLRFYRQSRRSETLLALIEVGQALGATLNLDTVLESFENVLSSLYHYNAFVIYLLDEADRVMRIKINRSSLPSAFFDFSLDKESLLTGVLKSRQGVVIHAMRKTKDPLIPSLRAFGSGIILPLQFEGSPLGLFLLTHPYPEYFDDEDLRVLTIVANQVAIAIKNVRLHEKTAFLAVTDSLTGLYTHGYFQAVLADSLAEQARLQKPASVLMIDLDWFKRVNDTFGHPQGDRVLAQLGRVVKNLLTPRDVLARYGGDEFVALIVDSNKMAAAALAERIRKTIQDVPFMIPGSEKSIRLSVSIGVATLPEDGSTGIALIDAADKAMYQAKQTGRNKVACWGQKEAAT